MDPLLLKLLSIPSKTGATERVYNFLLKLGTDRGWLMQKDDLNNLYATKGESETWPCVVAHMDTVHAIEKGGITPVVLNGLITGINPLTMQQTGIGGDDKCGIWAAIRCMDALPACKAAFFVDEEGGCIGSEGCDLMFFSDCRFVLQADRRGWKDFVDNISGPLSSDAFKEAILEDVVAAGYDWSHGMMTDVMALRDRKVGVSVANMSAGYYNPHSDGEYIDLMDLERACNLIISICLKLTDVYPFTYDPPVRQNSHWFKGSGGMHNGELDWTGQDNNNYMTFRCRGCHDFFIQHHMGQDGLCVDCSLVVLDSGLVTTPGGVVIPRKPEPGSGFLEDKRNEKLLRRAASGQKLSRRDERRIKNLWQRLAAGKKQGGDK